MISRFQTEVVRVVVIEDNADLGAEVCDLLAEDPRIDVVGYASDAASGLQLVRAEQPDLVVLDVGLPDRRGDQLAGDLKAACPELEIVAHTAADDRPTILAMLRAGAIAYAVKGRDSMELCDIVVSASKGLTYLDDSVAKSILPELLKGLNSEVARPDAGARRWLSTMIDERRFRIALQPIVRLDSGRVIGAEALLRMTGEDPLTPDEIFARASAAGMRQTLELIAVEAAMQEAGRLPPGVYLAVNASPAVAMTDELSNLVSSYTASPLVVEITEHDRIDDYGALRQSMAALKQCGARIAVDDAGAGFASLQHILDLEPDIIKLDRDITRNIDQDRRRRALARALSAYASEIEITILAEGIETEPEMRTLRTMGIELGQGFLLARPSFEPTPESVALPPEHPG